MLSSDMNLCKDGGGGVGSGSGMHCDASANFTNFTSDYDERNNHHIDADNVAILGTNDDKFMANEPMSTPRRCCFIASLLLCVFAVVTFVWILPCNDHATCPALVDRVKTHNWLNNYTKIELKGGVHVVNGLRSWEKNLIFLYRGDAIFPELNRSTMKRNGIVSLIGSSGAVAWYKELSDEQVAIDCQSLDVDGNGNHDCLILDEHGQLGALNPISGQWYWRYLERASYAYTEDDYPLLLPDLDGDGVQELLIVSSASAEQRLKNSLRKGDVSKPKRERNILRILSGRSGKPLSSDLRLHDCDCIQRLHMKNAQTIAFVCVNNDTETQRFKTLAELLALITNKSNVAQKLTGTSMPPRAPRRKGVVQRNVYALSGRELVVENSGVCPEECRVTVTLGEVHSGKMNVLHNFTATAMYGMTPVPWSFKNAGKATSGFVMKFWKWTSDMNSRPSKDAHQTREDNMAVSQAIESKMKAHNSKNANKSHVSKGVGLNKNNTLSGKLNQTHSNRTERYGRTKRSDFHRYSANDFNDFDKLIELQQTYSIADEAVRVTRSVGTTNNITKPNKLVGELLHNYKMQLITESVILVLFIGADTRIENTSQSNIVQFCRRRSNLNDRNEVVCQPDLNNQEDSILIADLDQDGSQELISYTSTFISDGESTVENWKLITYVRLLRLQAELPNLYDTQIIN